MLDTTESDSNKSIFGSGWFDYAAKAPPPCLMEISIAMECPDRRQQRVFGHVLPPWLLRRRRFLPSGLLRDYRSFLPVERKLDRLRMTRLTRCLLYQSHNAVGYAGCKFQLFRSNTAESEVCSALKLAATRKEMQYRHVIDNVATKNGSDDYVAAEHSTLFMVTFLLAFGDMTSQDFTVPMIKDRTSLQEALLQLNTIEDRFRKIGLHDARMLVFPGNTGFSLRREEFLSGFPEMEPILW